MVTGKFGSQYFRLALQHEVNGFHLSQFSAAGPRALGGLYAGAASLARQRARLAKMPYRVKTRETNNQKIGAPNSGPDRESGVNSASSSPPCRPNGEAVVGELHAGRNLFGIVRLHRSTGGGYPGVQVESGRWAGGQLRAQSAASVVAQIWNSSDAPAVVRIRLITSSMPRHRSRWASSARCATWT